MNTRIEQLTRNYLDSLNLSYYSRLDSQQKRKIIEINAQSEWIIFNAGSLRAKRKEYDNYTASELIWVDERNRVWDATEHEFLDVGEFLRRRVNLVGGYRLGEWEERDELDYFADRDPYTREVRNPNYGLPTGRVERVRPVWGRTREADGQTSAEHKLFHPGQETGSGFHPEYYDLTSSHLKEICQEINIHYLGENDEIDTITFMGGSGKSGDYTMAAFYAGYDGRVDDDYWVAVNKKEASEQYELLNIFCVNNDRRHWKKERDLNRLLNNTDIINSREGERERGTEYSTTKRDQFLW